MQTAAVATSNSGTQTLLRQVTCNQHFQKTVTPNKVAKDISLLTKRSPTKAGDCNRSSSSIVGCKSTPKHPVASVSQKSLSDELREASASTKEEPKGGMKPKLQLKQSVNMCIKRKILILADSHGRNLIDKFCRRLPSDMYSVQCIFKANATFQQITCDLPALSLQFNKTDYVIIMAGTNNLLSRKYISDDCVEKTVAALSHTNCMIVAVPYAKDNNLYLNNLAYKTNYQFQFIANSNDDFVKFIDANHFLNSRHKTFNGLHLNDKGKCKLVWFICKYYILNPILKETSIKPNITVITCTDINNSFLEKTPLANLSTN
uniref:Uncharacterized protein n=1 Tax=Photinus pyralis TaxID=7054 RepID=A0A1Y1L3W7_PHOPY